MIPSRRTTVGLILFQDTVNATMMKLFKIWCSLCHTECIDIYSAITSFPIFLPNQPMLMFQRVCRIQFHQGLGMRRNELKASPSPLFPWSPPVLLPPQYGKWLICLTLYISRKVQTNRWKCDKIRALWCVPAWAGPPIVRCSSMVCL